VRRSALPDTGTSDAAFLGMKAFPKKLLPLTLFGIAITSLFSVQPAQAYTVRLQQMGSNVVATGSGAINLMGLSFAGPGGASPFISPQSGIIFTGPLGSADRYVGYTGPTSFGSGQFSVANATSGVLVGIIGNTSPGAALLVPPGYVSGNALSSSSTFDNATFASLEVTPGTYVWTWGTGLPNQNFTLIIGGAGVPDGGSTVSLLGCALVGLAALRRKLLC